MLPDAETGGATLNNLITRGKKARRDLTRVTDPGQGRTDRQPERQSGSEAGSVTLRQCRRILGPKGGPFQVFCLHNTRSLAWLRRSRKRGSGGMRS